jgi:hypothetical protein
MNPFNPSYYFGAYWYCRKESISTLAGRLKAQLNGMAIILGANPEWWRLSEEDDRELVRMPCSVHSVEAAVAASEEQIDGTDDTKFRMSLDTSRDAQGAAGIWVSAGEVSEFVGNSFLLKFDSNDSTFGALLEEHTASEMLDLIITVWEPETAIVTHSSDRVERKEMRIGIKVGWLTYVQSIDVGRDHRLQPYICKTKHGRTILQACGGRFDLHSVAFRAGAEEIEKALAKAS